MANKKLTFYTEKNALTGGWQGRCHERPELYYQVAKGRTRDVALSGIKRMAKRMGGFTQPTGPSNPQPANFRDAPPSVIPAVVAPKKKRINRVAYVLDKSGSMAHLIDKATAALNENVRTLADECRKAGQTAEAMLVFFDSMVRIDRTLSDVSTWPSIRAPYANGSTVLWDAVGESIERLQDAPVNSDEDVSYLLVVVTDGEEMSSTRWNSSSIGALIDRVNATDKWTVTFLVPPGHRRTITNVGIHEGNVAEWAATSAGIDVYRQQVNSGTRSFVQARSNGLGATKSFYTDLSGLSTNQVKRALNDLSGNFRALQVEREADIKTFVESKIGQYVPGNSYYQLTKDEKKIQSYKELLVREKGKKTIYGGPDARQVLGIPDGVDLKVKPGNHANWDLFVQSTSVNRKLVRGTTLLVKV